MRFSLIDRITDLRAGESISSVKTLSLAEEYLQDHFPGFPVMPGVLMVEALTQSCAWLMRFSEEFRYSTVQLKEAKAVKFTHFVSPGRTLRIECTVQKRSEREWSFKTSGSVDEHAAVSARLVLAQSNLQESQPELAATDGRMIGQLRDLFGVLWAPPTAS